MLNSTIAFWKKKKRFINLINDIYYSCFWS